MTLNMIMLREKTQDPPAKSTFLWNTKKNTILSRVIEKKMVVTGGSGVGISYTLVLWRIRS